MYNIIELIEREEHLPLDDHELLLGAYDSMRCTVLLSP